MRHGAPRRGRVRGVTTVEWRLPDYQQLLRILKNPTYAGAFQELYGELARRLRAGDREGARAVAERYAALFGGSGGASSRGGGSAAGAGFVLDGFPRTVPQAEALDALLAGRGQAIESVLYLQVSEDELVRRLQGRRECPVCMRAYNLEGMPPRDGRHCDDHPAVELRTRADDGEAAVRQRFDEYRAKTAPLVEYYEATGRLRRVRGTGPADEVFEALRREAGIVPPVTA